MTSPWLRFLIGFASALIAVVAGFAIVMASIPSGWATPQEAAMSLPGDEVVAQPAAYWTVATTVHAPAEEVYPWLVQIGDTRAGYYSYMFIERLLDPDLYHNADRIHPEW